MINSGTQNLMSYIDPGIKDTWHKDMLDSMNAVENIVVVSKKLIINFP